MGKEKSLKFNMILNLVKNLVDIIFPFITFPYATKVLGVKNIGKYSFSQSVIEYFTLFSALGISTYAIREGAKIRARRTEIEKFSSQMFSMRLIFTFISYASLFIILLYAEILLNYRILVLLLSLSMIFKTIGMDWIFTAYEDFTYITIRTIVLRLISIAGLFLFVKNKDDLIPYMCVAIFSDVVGNACNHLYARKHCFFTLTSQLDFKRHIKPILTLFGLNIAITIYVSSDTTILGLFCGDYTVGIYALSSKVYSIIKTLLTSVLVVSIPRLSKLYGNKEGGQFIATITSIYLMLLTLMFPAILGIAILRKEIIVFISSREFIQAKSSLFILCIALFFCIGAYFWAQCVMIPMGMEGTLFKITLISAIVNIILNFSLIPFWKEDAAAFTTALAEMFTFFVCRYKCKKQIFLSKLYVNLGKIFIGCLGIYVTSCIMRRLINNEIVYMFATILLSSLVYIALEIILKNESIGEIINGIKNRNI